MYCEDCFEDKPIKYFKEGKKLFLNCSWCRGLKELQKEEIKITITKDNIVIERKV